MLLFVDNIFRFTQAGSEVSALLGRIPSAVGYQPTLATDLASLQERITTTQKGSITSVQAMKEPLFRASCKGKRSNTFGLSVDFHASFYLLFKRKIIESCWNQLKNIDFQPCRRRSTCLRTTSPTRRPPRPSRTWTPPRCCQGRLPSRLARAIDSSNSSRYNSYVYMT